ncbi:hypothetical protein A9F13_16g00594 [Clavispora lusitaniae]|uniref:Uncharacterized protein n=1 Tax=Clavispora lusitaniae TaxID=36911 RepID=A0AA91T0C4_CLALS|nr:hypothetical protein A9F13_16g00594 [Clavispora lusitaniae]
MFLKTERRNSMQRQRDTKFLRDGKSRRMSDAKNKIVGSRTSYDGRASESEPISAHASMANERPMSMNE